MEIPRHWRLNKQRYGLVGEICLSCDEKIFPPKPSHKCAEVTIFSSKLPLYTLSSYMEEPRRELQLQEQ